MEPRELLEEAFIEEFGLMKEAGIRDIPKKIYRYFKPTMLGRVKRLIRPNAYDKVRALIKRNPKKAAAILAAMSAGGGYAYGARGRKR